MTDTLPSATTVFLDTLQDNNNSNNNEKMKNCENDFNDLPGVQFWSFFEDLTIGTLS